MRREKRESTTVLVKKVKKEGQKEGQEAERRLKYCERLRQQNFKKMERSEKTRKGGKIKIMSERKNEKTRAMESENVDSRQNGKRKDENGGKMKYQGRKG